MHTQQVITVGPNDGTRIYHSLRAASRVLSGNGSDSVRHLIAQKCREGGGFVKDTWVKYLNN